MFQNLCYCLIFRKQKIVYVTESSSSSGEGEEDLIETLPTKKYKYVDTSQEKSESESDIIGSSDSNSDSQSSSSSEEEVVRQKPKHKISKVIAKGVGSKKPEERLCGKRKLEETVIEELKEVLKRAKMDMQKKDNLLFSTEQSQMVAAKKAPSTLSITSTDKPEDTVTMSKDDFKTLMNFVR